MKRLPAPLASARNKAIQKQMVTVISNEMNQLQAIIGKGHEMNDLQTIEMGGGGGTPHRSVLRVQHQIEQQHAHRGENHVVA